MSEFPNIAETKVTCERPDLEAIIADAKARQTKFDGTVGNSLNAMIEAARSGATIGHMFTDLYGTSAATCIGALPAHRLAERYEALRKRSDAHKAKTGFFPQVFLANLGKVAQHTARASFARNFFEAGGIEAITNNGFATADDVATAFGNSGAKIAIICGSDAQYADMVADVAKALKAKGASMVYLAGQPGDARSDYEAAGINEFVFVGADVLAICGTALDHLLGKQGEK